ncbi:hypothetical protein K458DRAFT_446791 [Lentithecium fluviatile CBS 122367]|uniref:Uncharacterized protein n=1 Tax=Lentithecium fluviatile CBS 122367 TaxID=1168545 RepID=A0A6G1IHT8_9PLEO|nr:hypothetical protein K458DRAFT_446791 [Lentithecium fluviatile CBS 122367]
MVYNWDGKEAECYQLYVQEKRSLDEVIEYWEQRGFTPSKRAFQTQFKRWDFPSKQNPAHKNPVLTARIKELWEKNYMQKEMLDALQAEGFQINDRELMRVRLRFNWHLRESRSRGPRKKKPKKQMAVAGASLIDQLAHAILQGHESSSEDESEEEQNAPEQAEPGEAPVQVSEPPMQPLDEAEALRRQLRLQQLQAESDEKWRARKRRRRTRGWAGLPADAPGEPPRFPSETTIDESKAYLSLDNKLYKQMRDQFQTICEEEGIIKKTVAGPEKWNQLLQRLIRENAHLANVFQLEAESLQQTDATWRPKNYKALSLDVICQDVMKRMRIMSSYMGMPEAKNALGLNPAQTRQVRNAFLAILKADHIINKLETGDDRWNELKQRWINESELLSRLMVSTDASTGAEADPNYNLKSRAIEILARDVMKRLRSEIVQKDASRKKQSHQGPGPGPAPPSVTSPTSSHAKTKRHHVGANSGMLLQSPSIITGPSISTDLQIDPSLLLAASDAAFLPPAGTPAQQLMQTQHQHPSRTHRPLHGANAHQNDPSQYDMAAQIHASSYMHAAPTPLPIYFRLHPHSTTPLPNKTVWLSVLQSSTVAEVKALAMREHPGTMVLRLEGLVMHRADGMDREVSIPVDDDAELSAFLGHVGGGKATFVVMLAMSGDAGGYT